MKVFISWSGNISKEIAEALTKWIPTVLQSVKPYFSPSDIEKGSKWETEITKNLNECSVGIICVTRENTEKPWILFEAGALSNKLEKSRVCPLLFELSNSDLTGPLATFQTTEFKKSEFKKLLQTINKQLNDNKVSETVFNEVFEVFFPKLETNIQKILSENKSIEVSKTIERSDREILEEILELSRRQYSKPKTKSGFRKGIEDLSELEKEYVEECILNYMKENNFRLKEFQLIETEEVYDFLKSNLKLRKICGNPNNLKKLIEQFKNK